MPTLTHESDNKEVKKDTLSKNVTRSLDTGYKHNHLAALAANVVLSAQEIKPLYNKVYLEVARNMREDQEEVFFGELQQIGKTNEYWHYLLDKERQNLGRVKVEDVGTKGYQEVKDSKEFYNASASYIHKLQFRKGAKKALIEAVLDNKAHSREKSQKLKKDSHEKNLD